MFSPPLPLFLHQGGDSDDEGEGLGAVDDTQPSVDEGHQSSQDPDGFSTYGENELVPEPHKVRQPAMREPAGQSQGSSSRSVWKRCLSFYLSTRNLMLEPAPQIHCRQGWGGGGSIPCLAQLVEQGMNTARVRALIYLRVRCLARGLLGTKQGSFLVTGMGFTLPTLKAV